MRADDSIAGAVGGRKPVCDAAKKLVISAGCTFVATFPCIPPTSRTGGSHENEARLATHRCVPPCTRLYGGVVDDQHARGAYGARLQRERTRSACMRPVGHEEDDRVSHPARQ